MTTPCVLLVLSFCEGRIGKNCRNLCFLCPLAIIVELPPGLEAMTSNKYAYCKKVLCHIQWQLRWRLVLLSWDSFTPAGEDISNRRPLRSNRSAKWSHTTEEKMEKVQLFSWFIISQLGPIAKSWHNATTAGPTSFVLSLVIWQVAKTLGIWNKFFWDQFKMLWMQRSFTGCD